MGPVTINILGHLQVFQQGMVALQMIFHPNSGSTDWSNGASWMGVGPVALLALTFALLHIATRGIWMQKVELHHVGLMLGMYAVLFVPTVSVDIHDLTTGQDAIVDNIPIGIAYPAAGISALAVDAANQIGTAFQSPTAINPPLDLNAGVASPLKQMLALRRFYYQVATQNPALTLGLASFVQSCVYPLANSGNVQQASFSSLSQDPNLLNGGNGTLFTMPIPSTNGGIVTMETLGTGSGTPCGASPAGQQCTESCAQAQSDLKTAYTNWYNGSITPNCSTAVSATTTQQDVPQIADCSASANASLAPLVGSASSGATSSNAGVNLANTGTFGSDFVQQIYAACIVSAGWQMGLNGTSGQNNPIVMPSYCQIQGTAQNTYNVENASSANMFLSNMLPMMSVLQFLFFALAPLAAAVMLFAGGQGIGIFTKYLMFGLWTQSWFPVAAVLNAYGQMTVSEELAKYGLAMTGGGSITPSATTFATIGQIPEVLLHVQNTLANVDMMLALTPVITMIVFTGSYMAMSQMAQDINGEVQTGKNVGLEAPSIKEQMDMAGVHPSANPNAPGMLAYGPSATAETMSAGNAVSLATEAGRSSVASSTQSAGTAWSNVARSSAGITLSNGNTLASSVMNSVTGSMDQSTAVGQMIKGMQSAGISADEQMAVIGGLSAVTKGAFQAAKNRGATEEQAVKEAEAAGKSFLKNIAGAIGGGVGKVLQGIDLKLNTQANSILSSKQGREALWDAGHKITSSLKQASQNSFGTTHVSGDTAQLGKSVDDAEQADAAVQNAVSDSDSFRQSASQIAQAGGNTQINAVQLAQAYMDAPGGNGSQLMMAALTKLYGGDVARMQADLAKMEQMEPGNPMIARARLLIRGINGNTAGLSAENRFGAMADAYQMFDGSSISTGQSAQDLTTAIAQGYAATAGRVGQQAAQVTPQAQKAAADARQAAQNADKRVNGGDPVRPPSGVSGNLSGSQAGAFGGRSAQSKLYGQGVAQVNAHTGAVPSPAKAQEMLGQAQQNLNSPLMKPVEWLNEHPVLTAEGITVFNFLSGVIGSAGAMAAAAAIKKAFTGKGGGGSEPPVEGPRPGGGPAEPARAPVEPLPEGSPTSRLPGGPSGSPSLGAPPEAPPPGGGQWVDVLDKSGNVVGRTAVTSAEAQLPERALAEVLAARAAQFGGVALRVGGSVLGLAASAPAIGVQLFLHSESVGAGTTPAAQQRQEAVKQLMLNDPTFAQQGARLQKMAEAGQVNTPEFAALQQQVDARIAQAIADPASIPKATPPSADDAPPVVPGV